MNIGCVQFDPHLGDPVGNRARADALLERDAIRPGMLNLLVLPEMAFSGYCFRDRTEIEPFAESAERGATAEWCRDTSRKLSCFVACGFAEKAERGQLYNSMLLVDPRGATVHIHRKHFLYATDETWATEGAGFQCRQIAGLGNCTFAICMDLNPKQFKAPFDRYEFASSLFEPSLNHREKYRPEAHRLNANLVIVCTNWLHAATDKEVTEEQHRMLLLNYWAGRMKPALDLPVLLVIANRVGLERGTRFAGTSCVIDLYRRAVLGNLDGREEAVLIVRGAPERG